MVVDLQVVKVGNRQRPRTMKTTHIVGFKEPPGTMKSGERGITWMSRVWSSELCEKWGWRSNERLYKRPH